MNWLTRSLHRLIGSTLELKSERLYRLPSSVETNRKFGTEHANLIRKRNVARGWMKQQGIKALDAPSEKRS